MSTDYDIVCRTCCMRMGLHDANHLDEPLQKVIEQRTKWELVGELQRELPMFIDMTVRVGCNDVLDVEWLLVHRGHYLAVVDEYDHDPYRMKSRPKGNV